MGHATRRSTSVLAIRVAQPPHEMRPGLYRHRPADAPRRVSGLGVMILDISLLFAIKSKIMIGGSCAERKMIQVITPNGPPFVLIGGIPGSGKSTLAVPLAAELGMPLLAKDETKEALMDALGEP